MSIYGTIISSLKYIKSHLKKEKRNILIGSSSIFLIVVISSFIYMFYESLPSLYYYLGQETIGDIDILVKSISKVKF